MLRIKPAYEPSDPSGWHVSLVSATKEFLAPLYGMLVHHRVTPSLKFTGNHLNTPGKEWLYDSMLFYPRTQQFFNALVQPYFNYCSAVRGHCNKSLSNTLQKLQNWAARILTFSSYDTSADPLFDQLNWKRLDTQRQKQVATMVYKSIPGLVPDCLGSLFTKYDPPYNLRNSENKLAVPLPRTNFLKNSFSDNGAVIWNSLSPELRQAKSLQSFRNGIFSI